MTDLTHAPGQGPHIGNGSSGTAQDRGSEVAGIGSDTGSALEQTVRTAEALAAPGKGILAADESTPTMAKRLASIGLESTEARRRAYREILFGAPGLGEHVSGVILFDETIRQCDSAGTPFVEVLRRQGVVPGIKVDGGTRPLAGFPDEVVTEGLDRLRDRLAEYAALGARFAKWRGVIRIGPGLPTQTCVESNAHALARYARLAQEAGLTPIVEPEVLMDGSHTLERCAQVTASTLRAVYDQLARHEVLLEGSLLKPNMVLPGKDSPVQASDDEIAAATIAVLRQTVPAAVPGIMFLSGGQSDQEATARLDALNRRGPQPWELSFSFGRALQAPVLRAWAGDDANAHDSQEALLHRARLNGAARRGTYLASMER
jgi:fructose-bisphosphate aldolase class I